VAALGRRHPPASPTYGGIALNPLSLVVLLGSAADAWILALVVIRGRRQWLQATFAACTLAFVIGGAAFVGETEGLWSRAPDDVFLGILLLAHALTAILVLGLIHGEALPRKRAAAFLLLVPVPILAFLAPSQGWTAATAFDGTVLGGFLVLCFGIALAEAIYARSTSPMFAPHAFWMAVGTVALVVGGPVYTYELLILGLAPLAGANVAVPIGLACFARVALQTDPFRVTPKPARGRTMAGTVRPADAIVFEEARPKYALRVADEEAVSGRPTLILKRRPPPVTTSGTCFASIETGRHAAGRALTTASEFLATAPGGLVVLEDLADLSALSGWRPVREALVRLRHVARGTASTAILCPSRLTEAERKSLADLAFTTWTLADPATEIVAILGQSFGSGAGRLVDSFCRSHGLRREDLTTDHVPALLAFLSRALDDLTGVVSDAAAHGLRAQFEAAGSVLRSFALQPVEDVARGKWPSRREGEAETDLVVTAKDYWKGREMEELFAAADAVLEREPLYERARIVFVEQLGEAGEGVLRTQLARLGKKPEDLEKRDLVRIADRTSVDLESVADIMDVRGEKDRIHRQIESIRQRLESIAEDPE
jgi:hypothetical protein